MYANDKPDFDDNEDDADEDADTEEGEIYRMLHVSADNALPLTIFWSLTNLSNLITCSTTLDHIQPTTAFYLFFSYQQKKQQIRKI